MSTNITNRPSQNEKKVWRPVAASEASAPIGSANADCVHFIAIEELQGAYVDDVWEEAEGGVVEEWDEPFTDINGFPSVRTIRRETPRARRYVLKYFGTDGQAKNALSSYNGPRKYKS